VLAKPVDRDNYVRYTRANERKAAPILQPAIQSKLVFARWYNFRWILKIWRFLLGYSWVGWLNCALFGDSLSKLYQCFPIGNGPLRTGKLFLNFSAGRFPGSLLRSKCIIGQSKCLFWTATVLSDASSPANSILRTTNDWSKLTPYC